MGTQTKTTRKRAPSTTPERVAALRDIAERDPLAAQDAAWAWFQRLGKRARHERAAAGDDLADLFACGQPAREVHGPTDGILVAPLIHPLPDLLLRSLMVWPSLWLGKSFDAAAARGVNRLPARMRWPFKLLLPFYSTRDGDGHRIAFDFVTRVERGGVEPSVDVLVIDYVDIDSNPWAVRHIRDELVEIVPGANLGRILWHQGDDRYANIGYFALRTPAS